MKFLQSLKTTFNYKSLLIVVAFMITITSVWSTDPIKAHVADLATSYDRMKTTAFNYSIADCAIEATLEKSYLAAQQAYWRASAIMAEETECQSVSACDMDGSQNNFNGFYCENPLSIGATGNAGMEVGVIATGYMIPAGATILSADIQFTAESNSTGSAAFTVYGIAEDDAGPFSATDDILTRPRTSATASWTPGTWTAGDAGTAQKTTDLTALVQEIVDRPGYALGNNIGFIVGGKGRRMAESFDTDPASAPVICITYDVPEPPSSTCDDCPQLVFSSLDGVPNFPTVDLLNVCSSPDTISLLVYNNSECPISNVQVGIAFDEGLSYGGFVDSHYPDGTVGELDVADAVNPVFLIPSIDSAAVFVINIGVVADCAVDITSELPLNFDADVNFSYPDSDGSTGSCSEMITEIGEYNGGVKIPVLNVLSVTPPEQNIMTTANPACQTILISQDGLQSQLSNFDFEVVGLNLDFYAVESMAVNGIAVTDYTIDPMTSTLLANIDGQYFGPNFGPGANSDDLFDVNEDLNVEICYSVEGCTDEAMILDYNVFYGCNDEVCGDVSSMNGAVNFTPNFGSTVVATSSNISYGGICGADLSYDINIESANPDPLDGLWQDLIVKYSACLGNGLSISGLMVNGTVLDASLWSVTGSALTIDFSTNTNAAYGLTDEDGGGVLNDLVGGTQLTFTTMIDIGCSDAMSSCSGDLACFLDRVEVNGQRNCGQGFQTNQPFTPAIDFNYGEISSTDNTMIIAPYSIPIAEVFNTTDNVWNPGLAGLEYGYEFGLNNITPCASPGGIKLVANIVAAGNRINNIRYEDMSATYQGNPVGGTTAEYETIDLGGGVTDTIGLNITIPAGDAGVALHDYYFNLEYRGDCFPNDYMFITYKVVEECDGCGGDPDPCEIVRSCGSAANYVIWNGSDCPCVMEGTIADYYRTNYGFADKEMTMPLTKDDVPRADQIRFLPGDTLFRSDEFTILDIDEVKKADRSWLIRSFVRGASPATPLIADVNHMKFLGWYWVDSDTGIKTEIGVPDCIQNYPHATRDNYQFPGMWLRNYGVENWSSNINSAAPGGPANDYGICKDDPEINPNYPPEIVNYEMVNLSTTDYSTDHQRLSIYWQRPESCPLTAASQALPGSMDHVNPCFEEFWLQFPMKNGDKIVVESETPLIHNPAFDLQAINGTSFSAAPELRVDFIGYGTDEATCGQTTVFGDCSDNQPMQQHIPGPVTVATDVVVEDCDTEVNYEFGLSNPVPTDLAMGELPWFENEYRPYMATEYLQFEFPNNMVYLGDGVIIMPDGSEVTFPAEYIQESEGNLSCFDDGNGGTCCVAANTDTLASLKLVDEQYLEGLSLPYGYGPDGPNESGEYCDIPNLIHKKGDPFPHLMVGGTETCTYGIRYSLASLCPEDVESSDFRLEYQFAEPYIPTLAHQRSNTYNGNLSTATRDYTNTSYYYMFPDNPFGENCSAAADEGCRYYFQKITTDPNASNYLVNPMRQGGYLITNPQNFEDNSQNFPPLLASVDNILIADEAGVNEQNVYMVCSEDNGTDMATHQNVVTSIIVPVAVQFIGADDENDAPLNWILVESTTEYNAYAIESDSLQVGECATIKLNTELLFCPIGLEEDIEICMTTTSGCIEAEKAALFSAEGGACDAVGACYQYISQEAEVQAEWMPANLDEIPLCTTFELMTIVKNVKVSTLTDIETMWWFPQGLNFVPGSWEVSYPGGPSNTVPGVSIPDPTPDASQNSAYGTYFEYLDDGLWSSSVDMIGLPGVGSGADSNFVMFTFEVETVCDEFTSGTSIWFQADGADPCESRTKSMFVDSPPIIIENANPINYPQFFVFADPIEANCGVESTINLTYLNTSPLGETDNSMVCMDIEMNDFDYVSGSVAFVSPAGHMPNFTETENGNITHICFDVPDGIGPGQAFQTSFSFTVPEDVDCGAQDLGVGVSSEIMSQECMAQGIECSVFVLNSVNPIIEIDFLPPLTVADQNLTVGCGNGDGTVPMCYTVDLENSGPFYSNSVTVALIRDLNFNGQIDDFDEKLDSMDHVVLLDTDDMETLEGCFNIDENIACPVFLMIMQETNCVCDAQDYYYDSIEPEISDELGGDVVLCPDTPLTISNCGDYTFEVVPAAGAEIVETAMGDSLEITLNPGFGVDTPVRLDVTSEIGGCQEFTFSTDLSSLGGFTFGPFDTLTVCNVGCQILDLEIPSEYAGQVTVEWLPNVYLDDNTSLTPEICDPAGDVNYFVNVTFTQGEEVCVFDARYPIEIEEQPIDALFDQGSLCTDATATYVAPGGFTNYNWILVADDSSETPVQAGSSGTFIAPQEGTYLLEYYNVGDVCKSRSATFDVLACPVFEKTITTITPTAVANEYIVSYEITVENTSGYATDYDLYDMPGFDDDIVISSVSYTSDAGVSGGLTLPVPSAPGWLLGDDVAIAAMTTQTYTISYIVSMDLASLNGPTPGDGMYTQCGQGSGAENAGPGEGLYNNASLDLDDDGTPETEDDACGELPYLTLDKTLVSTTATGDNCYDIVYTIEVENIGGAVGTYDLVDDPGYDDDFTLTSAIYTTNAVGNPGGSLPTTTTLYTLADDQMIDPAVKDSFTLFINVCLDLEDGVNGDDVYTASCGSTVDPTNPEPTEGLYNLATLDVNNDNVPDLEDEVCNDVPYFVLNKSFVSVTETAAGAYDVIYEITVENIGGTTGTYDLADLPSFDDDFTITAAEYTSDIPSNGTLPTTPPATGWVLGDDIDLVNGVTHTYTLTVGVSIDVNDPGTPGDGVLTDCGMSTPGTPIAGEGLFNEALLDTDNDGTPDLTDEVCPDLEIFDLALIKQLSSATPGPFSPGDDVTFTITVYNQGTEDAYEVEVVDYIPAGLMLSDADWTEAGGIATINNAIPFLAAGQSTTLTIDFTIDEDFMETSIVNVAEISSADDDTDPNNTPPTDVDSTPDATDGNDAGGDPESGSDDSVDGDGTGVPGDSDATTDEDDADPVLIEIEQVFDLALTKVINTTATPGPYAPGDDVTFTIEVTNQGTLDAFNVSVVDYIPTGLSLNDGAWTDNAGIAELNMAIASIPVGTSETVDITFTIDADYMETSIVNVAEISSADDDMDDTNTPPVDVDSNPDAIEGDDAGGAPGTDTDNSIDGDGTGAPGDTDPTTDEDDSDPALVEITQTFDLALTKVINTTATPGPYMQGSTVTFTISVINQGTLDAFDVEVVDYIPEGLTLADGNWTAVGDIATINTLIASVPAGTTETVDITFTIDDDFMGDSIENTAEISSADDDMDPNNTPPTDEDSTPDNNPDDDDFGGDNVTDNSNGDEDDSDPATVPVGQVFDLALTKTLSELTPGPFMPGSTVTFDINVFNQGSLDAFNVYVVDYIPEGLTLADPNWSAIGTDVVEINNPIGYLAMGDMATVTITFTIDSDFMGSSIENFSEISSADNDNNPDNTPPTDFDSEPDTDPNDDVVGGDNVTDGTGGDDDDHDPEVIEVEQDFDLALVKIPLNEGPFAYGDVVAYEIEVFNQGTLDAYSIDVVDVLPCGLEYAAANNPLWSYDMATSTATTTIAGPLMPGTSETVIIYSTVVACSDAGAYVNYAEISGADNVDGDPMDDSDGTFDADPTNDPGGESGEDSDDVVDGDGTGPIGSGDETGDEDNQDPAEVMVFDLALAKTTTAMGPFNEGDVITFDITVTNQGNVDGYDVDIVDVIPCGFEYSTSNDAIWTYDAGANVATTTIEGPVVASGGTAVVSIDLILTPCAGTDSYTNIAEISGADDEDGEEMPDADGSFDDNPNNDPGGNPDSPSDDVIDGDGTGTPGDDVADTDEDNQDPELVEVVDLAIDKQLASAGPFNLGGTVTFDVVVTNQGNVDAYEVGVIDYLPMGLAYLASNDPTWSYDGTNATTTIPFIAAGASATVPITLEIVMANGGADVFTNVVEITGSEDENGDPQDDIDSDPDTDPDNDPEGEDDIDPEGIQIFDLALNKTTMDEGPFSYGDAVTFTITVYNQGSIPANDIDVIDHIPCGFSYLPSNEGVWTFNAITGNASTTIETLLPPGDSVSVDIVLQVERCTGDVEAYTNIAEISGADDYDTGLPGDDNDSDPDFDPDNDGDPVDNEVNDPNDEDDHDPELIEIFDVALAKTLVTGGPYAYGDLLTFDIEVTNQGNTAVFDVEVSDYIPAGYSFSTLLNGNWTEAGGIATTTIPQIDPQTSETVSITLELVMTSGGSLDWYNEAEVSGMNDDEGNPVEDIDSDLDNDPNNDNDVALDSDDDNEIDGDSTAGEDEDDNDPAGIDVFDLALTKIATTAGPYSYGQMVDFEIEVFNQGSIVASNIEVTDYIPCGYIYAPVNDGTWTYDATSGNATTVLPGTLDPGASTTVTITLQIQPCDDAADAWTNVAEVSSATDDEGTPQDDIDGAFDDDETNDPGGNPESPSDDVVDGDGTGTPGDDNPDTDEDNADPVFIEVFDLALFKTLDTPATYAYGDVLDFSITVINQGNVDAFNVEVTDYLPAGFDFDPAANPLWTLDASGYLVADVAYIPVGGQEVLPLTLTLTGNGSGTDDYINVAEVSDADNDMDPTNDDPEDADSDPDNDPDNDNDVEPGDDNDDVVDEDPSDPFGEGDDDEDDSDPAGPIYFDLALNKTTDAVGPFSYGDEVVFDLNVYNQGTIVATNVAVTETIPCGYMYAASNDGTWTYDAATGVATTTITDLIEPGESSTVAITLVVQPCSEDGAWVNIGEISDATDDEGNPQDDIDSDPDTDPTNDGDPTDDDLGGNGSCADCRQTVVIPLNDATIPPVVDEVYVNGMVLALPNYPYDLTDPAQAALFLADCQALGYVVTEELAADNSFVSITVEYPGVDFENVSLNNGAEFTFECSECNSGGPDEDDHDPEEIEVFDLALFKTLVTEEPYAYGDALDFTITVINQGNVDGVNVEITDYLAAGYEFDAAANMGWTLNAEGNLEYTVASLPAGEQVELPLTLTLTSNGNGTADYTNVAEISDADDDDDPTNDGPEDADSDPDNDPDNDNDVEPGDDNDDVVDEDPSDPFGEGDDDEDDSDPAGPTFYDLALTKTTTDEGPFGYGDAVTFTMTVYNQGFSDAANIVISEYIPCGYVYDSSNDGTWTYDAATGIATTMIVDLLEAGTSTTVDITLTIQYCGDADAWVNISEITEFTDEDGNPEDDIDSTPDNDPTNDGGGVPDGDTDDEIDGDGTGTPGDDTEDGDEDDSDPEVIEIFDLALFKTVVTELPYSYGDDLEFAITVINQGNVDGVNVVITDYMPAGYNFDAAINPGWTMNGMGQLEYTIASLLADTEVVLPLILELTSNGNGAVDYTNVAEISDADDDNDPTNDGPEDADSDPDNDPDNDNDVVPGDDNDDVVDEDPNDPFGEGDDDEDDSDPALPLLFDLALTKTTSDDGPYAYGDEITFTMTVYNQGGIAATNIGITEHIPCGYIYEESNNSTWSYDAATGIATTTITELLQPGTTTTVDLLLTVQPCAENDAWTNIAEINEFTDEEGEPQDDIDSTPDGDPNNDGDPTDNEVDGTGNCGDCIQTVVIPFGGASLPIVSEVYVDGMVLGLPNYPYNLTDPAQAALFLSDCLALGYDVTEDFDAATQMLTINVLYPGENFDSFNFNGGEEFYFTCSDCNSGGPDEDDHDPEMIEVFDLALIKTIDNVGPYAEGETATYEIEVFNQGNVDAYSIEVTDYLNEGYSFDAATNAGWSQVGDDLVYTIAGPLAPGSSEVITLNLVVEVPVGANVNSWYNEAEISDADNDTDPTNEGPEDSDSTPDNDPDNDNDLVDGPDDDPIFDEEDDNDNEINENPNDPFGLGDDDEDDNDAAGILVVGGLGDTVWKDLDGDGVQDADEPGVPGVVVILTDCDGNFINMQVTDSDGFYFFNNLIPGDYQVQFDISGLPEGCAFTYQDQGGDDALDSDVNEFGMAPCTTIEGGEYDSTFDAGLLVLASLGDFVWHDLNGDGIQNAGEPGIEGVVVNLYDENGELVESTVTDENGYYLFDNLYPGTYFVEFIDPDGFESTFSEQGNNDGLDSDITNEIIIQDGGSTTDLYTLAPGEHNPTIDAGYYMCVPIGETVWYDVDTDNVEDPTENGINGMKVTLWRLHNGVWTEWDDMYTGHKPGTPSDDGYYKFCAPPGSYYLHFELPPIGLVQAQPNVGSDLTDSDVTNGNGLSTTNTFTVQSGDVECTIGAGYYPMAEVGNFVWEDSNYNGIQDVTESPLEGVVVQAYDMDDNMISEVVTDEEGEYNMEYLQQQSYYLRFTPPTGYGVTVANAGDDDMDSDVTHAYGANTTNAYSLNSGEQVIHVDAGMAFGVLPVEWLYVKAENRGEINLVEWATATEINTDYFEVERRVGDAPSFESIGKVEAAGMSNIEVSYDYEDADIHQSGVYYYRIKQVDRDGRVDYSDIVSVTIDKVATTINMYPNPAISMTMIKVNGTADNASVSVFTKDGKLIRSGLALDEISTGSYELRLDLANFLPGVYTIQIETEQDTWTEKLIVVR